MFVVFFNQTFTHFQNITCYPHLKNGQYIYWNQLTKLETIMLWLFWDALQFDVADPNYVSSTWIYTTNACPTKN
jgi:hypothetical protein